MCPERKKGLLGRNSRDSGPQANIRRFSTIWLSDRESAEVQVTAMKQDGSAVDAECLGFRGSAGNPMSREERLEKITDCVQRVLSDRDSERMVTLIEGLENVADISEIMEILGRKPGS